MTISFELLKVSKLTSFDQIYSNLYIFSHGEARNIKSGNQVNLIQRVLLGTLPQEVLKSYLIFMRLWQISLSLVTGATVIKFGQQKELLDRGTYGTSPLGVVLSLPFDQETLINLYISSYRKDTGAKTYFKSSHQGCSIKRQSLKRFEYSQENVLESLFNVAGLQDYCKTYLLLSHFRFYFSLGKTLKNFMNFS